MQSLNDASKDFKDYAVSFLIHCGSDAVYVLNKVYT